MNTITPVEVLDYYDGIQIFRGCDSKGCDYISLLVDETPKYGQYLTVKVSTNELKSFCNGSADLRALLLEAANIGWYIVNADAPFGEPLVLLPQYGIIPEKFLPLEGFTLCMDDKQDK